MIAALLLTSLFSVAVAVEAESNYATVTRSEQPSATAVSLDRIDSGVVVELAVRNTFDSPLRIQYVHLVFRDGERLRSDSVPFHRRETLASGRDTAAAYVADRHLEGLDLDGNLTIEGYLAVEIYNDYRLKVPIERTTVEA